MLYSFLFQILKLHALATINPWSQCFRQEKKKKMRRNLFGDKTIQKCLNIDATH